jgi:hypothetical protein
MVPKFISNLARIGRTYQAGGYPPFVYQDRDASGYLPVFYFHDVNREDFARQLSYLKENNYSSIDCDSAVTLLDSGDAGASRAVVLTVDDGLVSLYDVIFPLLAEYQVKVVAYIVPDWIGQEGYITWEQCSEMHASGLVDIQSHSCAHARRITGLTVQGVWERNSSSKPDWDVPELKPSYIDSGVKCFPVFRGESLFGVQSLLSLPEHFWLDCLTLASAPSGSPSIRDFQLLADRYRGEAMHFDADALLEEMAADLLASRAAIEARLPGHKVRHFAFPWHLNSSASWKALDMAGFNSAAVGLELPGESQAAGSARKLLRVNGDFLYCLPGKRRQGFTRIVVKKIKKNLGLGF